MNVRLFLCCAFLVLLSCSEKDQEEEKTTALVTLTGKITHPAGDKIKFSYPKAIGYENITLAEVALDSAGAFTIQAPWEEARPILLAHGDETSEMYLTPGDSLYITLDTEAFDETITYQGKGEAVNNYLASKLLKKEEAQKEIDNIYKLEPNAFMQFMDSLQNELVAYFDSTFAGKVLSADFSEYEKNNLIAEYAVSHGTYPDGYRYYNKKEVELPESFNDYKNQLPMDDPKSLRAEAFRTYLQNCAFDIQTYFRENNGMQDTDSILAFTYDSIKHTELNQEIKDYMLADNILRYIQWTGIEGLDTLLSDYRKFNSDTTYLAVINEEYAGWEKISKGEPAPDFKYVTMEGDSLALSDFKGKVVYVDVWATWCGPCRAELPHSKKLKEKFAQNDNIVFMYVSIDADKDAWKKMLNDDPEFKGVHLLADNAWESSILKKYMIQGIPRYMLVDKQGNIIAADAARPSSGDEIIGKIEKALSSDISASL